MTLNFKRPRRRTVATAAGVTAVSLLGSSLMLAPAQAADVAARSVSVTATEAQGVPGQYMVDQSSNGSLWVTSSYGRPAIVTATLAKVNAETLNIEAVAQLPVTRAGTGEAAGFTALGAYGVAVDDVNGTVWVTNTRVNSVSVYRQSDMQLLFTDLDPKTGQGKVQHPREVIVDQASGKAFVGTSSSIVAYDLKTYADTVVENPSANAGRQAKMNLALDSESHRLFVPDLAGNTLEIYNTQTLKLEKTINLVKNDESASLSASDVAYDKSLNELYVSSQGQDGKNSGVSVYDATSGDFKKFISFGTQALAIDNDEERDFVYVTDFKTAQVGVIDAKAGAVVSTVQAGKSGANDVHVLNDGSVVVVNKGTFAENVEVPFTLNYVTGQYQTSAVEIKSATTTNPISANSIVKFTVTDNGTAATNTAETQTVTTADGATVTGVKVVENGKAIEVTGTGWKHPNGTGSYVSVKADKGTTTRDGNGVIAETEADASGNFKLTIAFPSTSNGYNKAWEVGSEHTLHFLTGSMKEGDVVRSPILKVTVGAAAATPATEVVQPTVQAFAGYPAASVSDPDSSLISHASYTDIKEGDQFWEDVQWVTDTRVAQGWEDGTYRPLQGIDRGAMAAYLYRLAGSPRYTAPETSPFTDVATDHPFYKEIAWLKASGITTGWSDGTYRPDETINRDAMAAFFYRAAGSPEYAAPTGSVFADVSSSTAFAKEIAWMKDQKIARGWEDGTYRPTTAINRDAMAAFVHRFADTNDVKVTAK